MFDAFNHPTSLNFRVEIVRNFVTDEVERLNDERLPSDRIWVGPQQDPLMPPFSASSIGFDSEAQQHHILVPLSWFLGNQDGATELFTLRNTDEQSEWFKRIHEKHAELLSKYKRQHRTPRPGFFQLITAKTTACWAKNLSTLDAADKKKVCRFLVRHELGHIAAQDGRIQSKWGLSVTAIQIGCAILGARYFWRRSHSVLQMAGGAVGALVLSAIPTFSVLHYRNRIMETKADKYALYGKDNTFDREVAEGGKLLLETVLKSNLENRSSGGIMRWWFSPEGNVRLDSLHPTLTKRLAFCKEALRSDER